MPLALPPALAPLPASFPADVDTSPLALATRPPEAQPVRALEPDTEPAIVHVLPETPPQGLRKFDLGIVPDQVEATSDAIRRARDSGADVLVTTGGASVGDYDLVQRGLKTEGLELSFWRVALRPGLPILLATGFAGTAEGAGDHGLEVMAKPYDQTALVRRMAELARARGNSAA